MLVIFLAAFLVPDKLSVNPSLLFGVGTGLLLILGGAFLARIISGWLEKKHSDVRDRANQVLFGLRTKEDLSNTLAVEVEELISRCRAADEIILGNSMAIMIDEFRSASSFEDRKSALVTAIDFLEKLTTRLSPWYVKYEKLIVTLISLTGLVSGVLKIIDTIAKL
jgi:hypothetical protein